MLEDPPIRYEIYPNESQPSSLAQVNQSFLEELLFDLPPP
jgi:hypothetical protein